MILKIRLHIPVLLLLVLMISHLSYAQDSFDILPHVPQKNHYSKIEQGLRNQIKDGKMGLALGESLRPQLITALAKGYFISDDTIKEILLIWTSYHHDAKSCLGFLDDLSKVIYNRPEIESHILYNRLVYLNPVTEKEEYDKANEDLWKITKYAGIRLDYYDITSTFNAAQNALNNKDKVTAAALFARVFYYPWYRMENSVSLEYFFTLYKRSAIHLIHLRIGDMEGLKQLKFATGVEDELNPILQRAIEETKKMDAKKKEDTKN